MVVSLNINNLIQINIMSYTDAFLEIGALINRKVGEKKVVEQIILGAKGFEVEFSDSDHLFPFKYTGHGVIKFLEIFEKVENKIAKENLKDFLG